MTDAKTAPPKDKIARWKHALPAAFFSLFSVAALALPPQAPATGEIAVVFAPFTSEETAWTLVREAGGFLVAPTRIPNVVVAYADDPGFNQRIRQAGALLLLPATGLCAPISQS